MVNFHNKTVKYPCYICHMKLRPHHFVSHVTQVTPELLRAHGVKAVMLDLDDTLVASKSATMATEVHHWCQNLQRAGFRLLLLSNGSPRRVEQWSQHLDIHGMALSGKPFPLAFGRALKLLGLPARQTAMVGDQLFTDTLGGNLHGTLTILVAPLSERGLPHTRLLRHLEKRLLKNYPPVYSASPRKE